MPQGITQSPGISLVGNGLITAVLASGANNDLNPTGFGPGTGRIDLDSTAGVANITGLRPGYDGQRVTLRLVTANAVTCNNLNGGSAATAQFSGTGDSVLAQRLAVDIVYYAGIGKWVFVP